MARSRLYGWNGEFTEKPLSGQALIVFNGLRGGVRETTDDAGQQVIVQAMLTGHEWADRIGNSLATRQDPYRVVLYYILELKKRGVIKTAEFDIDAVTRDADAAVHGVTVKTEAAVVERYVGADTALTSPANPSGDESEDEPEDDDEEDDENDDDEDEDEESDDAEA